jgi:hypothetical protein
VCVLRLLWCCSNACANRPNWFVSNNNVFESLNANTLNHSVNLSCHHEVSADMLKDFGAEYVIVGHSERRSLYGESDEMVAEKVQVALSSHFLIDFHEIFSIESRNN